MQTTHIPYRDKKKKTLQITFSRDRMFKFLLCQGINNLILPDKSNTYTSSTVTPFTEKSKSKILSNLSDFLNYHFSLFLKEYICIVY